MNGKLTITLDDGSKIRGKIRNLRIIDAPPVVPPPSTRMLLGTNSPQYWGDQTEDGRLRPDGTLDPRFVEYMEPFRVHRTMETVMTNGSTVTDVDVPAHPGWPFDEVAAHATVSGRRPWVCVPHMATDSFVEYLANLFGGLHPIVEYTNEPFNTGFAQSEWCADQAVGDGLCPPYSGGAEQRQAAYAWTAKRTREIGGLWRAIDPDCEVVYSVGMTDPPTVETLIFESGADALSTAAYLGIESAWPAYTHVRTMNVLDLCGWLMGESMDRLIGWVGARKATAVTHGLPLYIYEGGQHVKPSAVPSSLDAQGSVMMGDVYAALLEALDEIGVGLFCHYQGPKVWSTSAAFGIVERVDEWTPKYRALRAWAGV